MKEPGFDVSFFSWKCKEKQVRFLLIISIDVYYLDLERIPLKSFRKGETLNKQIYYLFIVINKIQDLKKKKKMV